MLADPFVTEVLQLIDRQGTTIYAALALEELGVQYISQVPDSARTLFVRRVEALRREDL